ncbi:hypothetical protein Thiowin_04315 [Thiorhodovibrio winogradskyi]|uniref:Gluconate 2-dehydrogenase subunit 3 family protein n=1 Tax=Thiorhodovibrio winogradskyi TaxID=77007 RepID=A0ABZ0SDV0_9GAMM|nr:gluconate 2-dehydrogenase subunit 3 family protein [Thiorhodovibrio winogradskyi]
MIRRDAPTQSPAPAGNPQAELQAWHQTLLDRRAFLARCAGVTVAGLFAPLLARAATGSAAQGTSSQPAKALSEAEQLALIDAVQQHLFPSESEEPGAREINALPFLRFVLKDAKTDSDEPAFILNGAGWLEDLSRQRTSQSFLALDSAARESLLRETAASEAGENWLSTLLLYLMEALLTDPAYGGNPDGIGWRWLEHIPGYPRPDAATIYPRLPR